MFRVFTFCFEPYNDGKEPFRKILATDPSTVKTKDETLKINEMAQNRINK
jgi:hypothetical protein